MKYVVLAVMGFALGMACADLRLRVDHIKVPSIPALPSLPASLVSALTPSAPSSRAAPRTTRLRAAIEPVQEVLFGPLNDRKAIAVALEETAQLESVISLAPSDGFGDSARKLFAHMKSACSETERFAKSNAQPISEALGDAEERGDFFGSVFEKRWRANMAVIAAKAEPEWNRFVEVDASAVYSDALESAIAKLMNGRRLRELERTAFVFEGDVVEVFRRGVLVRVWSLEDTVFISGIPGVTAESTVRVLAHPEGQFQYNDSDGRTTTVPRFRYFRDVTK